MSDPTQKLPKEIRGDRQGLQHLLDEGVEPDRLALNVIQSVKTLLTDLMDAIPRESVKSETAHQVVALIVTVENAVRALEMDFAEIPEDAREAIIALLAQVLHIGEDDAEEREEPTNGDRAEDR